MLNFSPYNIYIYTVLGLAGFTYGFGFSVFVTAEGQPGFYSYFNLDPTSKHAASIIDAVNALFTAGAAFGSIAQSIIADKWGRKIGLAVAAMCSLIGGALAAGAVDIPMLIIVRLLQGFGLGMILPLVPLYLSKIAPPHQRGLLSGLTVLSFGTGYMVCAWIAVGTYHANATVQWRVPLALACLSPVLLLIALPTIPETPRYLVWVGKKEEAWKILRRLHRTPKDPEDKGARAEYTQIVLQVEHDKEEQAGFIAIFKKPTLRRRAILVIFLLFATPSTGIIGISNYLPVIFSGLGLNGVMPLVMYGVWCTIGTSVTLLIISIVDRVGRRTLLLIAYPLLALVLLAESLLQNAYINTDDSGGLGACLLFLLIYIITFQFIDAPAFIWASEIWPTSYRAKGISLGFCSFFVGSLTYTTPSGVAFNAIGWHFYLLYMGLCLICSVIIYFFTKETKHLPMEELAALFGDEVVVHLTKDGTGVLEDFALDKVKSLGDREQGQAQEPRGLKEDIRQYSEVCHLETTSTKA